MIDVVSQLKSIGIEPEDLGKGYLLAKGHEGKHYLIGSPDTDEHGNYLIPQDIMLAAQEKSQAVFGENLNLVKLP